MSERATKFTIETKKVEYYSDFPTNFDRNPLTGYLARVTNEESVKQSLRNLILTMWDERFYNAYVGSRLRRLLFEPMDAVTEEAIRMEILNTIKNDEPRVVVGEVIVRGDPNNSFYAITVVFGILNYPNEEFSLNIVKRVR